MRPLDAAAPTSSGLRDYLSVLRRRRWLLLQAVVVVPIVAVAVSFTQPERFSASASVLLNRQNLAAGLTGAQEPVVDQAELLATQVELASTPEVAATALAKAGVRDRSPEDLLASSSVAAKGSSDVLAFSVEDSSAPLARRLANAYAEAFVTYRHQLDTEAVARARRQVSERLAQLQRTRLGRSGLYTGLAAREEQLRTLEALQGSNAKTLGSAPPASRIQPRPVRNGVLGLLLGLVLGLVVAFGRDALDTRIRSADEIGKRLDLPLLGRLPAPPNETDGERLVMIETPMHPSAEAFRMLRTNLQVKALGSGVRSLIVTSALGREGKSTTAANLAVAFARAGKRTVVVDLDLRQPVLDRFFEIEHQPGLTDVALGRVSLAEAIVDVAISEAQHVGAGGANGDVEPVTVAVLPSGTTQHDPGELVGAPGTVDALRTLRERFEIVIVDSPPFLAVSDPISLARAVDGLLLVANPQYTRRPLLNEVKRILSASPARALGYVLTGADPEPELAHGYGWYMLPESERNGRERVERGRARTEARSPRA